MGYNIRDRLIVSNQADHGDMVKGVDQVAQFKLIEGHYRGNMMNASVGDLIKTARTARAEVVSRPEHGSIPSGMKAPSVKQTAKLER